MSPLDETRLALAGRENELVAALGITPTHRRHIRCPLPSHNDLNPSWRWIERRGRWYCTCGSGDIFDLVIAMGRAHDFSSALRFVREVLGLSPISKPCHETAEQHAARLRRQAELQTASEKRRRQCAADEAAREGKQLGKARGLYESRKPAMGTIVETYLRSRGLTCPVPANLGFLPACRPDHHPAMIAPFGLAYEPEPGELLVSPSDVRGVHLTLLQANGLGKAKNADGNSKLTIGIGHNLPIVLAPATDSLGLVIAEGIEEALTAHQATKLGAWAAGTANRLPGLAKHVADYIEAVTIIQDNDGGGIRFSMQLGDALAMRGFDVFIEKGLVGGP
jgi:hypothetical protein